MRACLEDQGSCGCCLILQEVNRLRTNFNTTLTKLEKEYSLIKQRLNNTEASRIAFSVTFTDTRFLCYGPFRDDKPIIYNNVFLNLGGGYNVGTGIFTVPRSGVYTIAISIYSDAGAAGSLLAACASLQVNGQLVAASTDKNSYDQEDSATIVVVLQLRAEDQVAVNLLKDCFLCDNSHYNTFSAFLLYAAE
uniref:caprin-2-like n=1 Tax=Monopterus albus TaxID=43700 RepID=UPI0009B457D5|nr:caprin-2-like [Monopterus albus]